MNAMLIDHKSAITELCKQFNVKHLFVFGSVLTEEFNSKSDVDFLVEFHNIKYKDYATNYFDFKDALNALLGRSVDIVEYKAIKNPFFRATVNANKLQIYG